jgi:hypothetical protein
MCRTRMALSPMTPCTSFALHGTTCFDVISIGGSWPCFGRI